MTMKQNKLGKAVKLSLAGLAFGALAACGGGSGGGGSDPTRDVGSSGAVTGPVTGFGSVYVNGVRFDTDSSELESDDGIEREVELEKGMIVTVRGEWDGDEGRASQVRYDDTLRGPLTGATWNEAQQTGVLNIIGQAVAVDSKTVFRGATPEELRDGAANTWLVRISGWPVADGRFRASFVGARLRSTGSFDDLNEIEIEGQVSNLDAEAQTFTINGLPVNYASAISDDGLSLSELSNGRNVDVEGLIESGVVIAEEIEIQGRGFFRDDDDVEFSGPLSADFDTQSRQFTVNGMTIQVTGDTEFDDGLSGAADLVSGLLVSVEGQYRDGIVFAEEIEAAEGEAELEASISAIDRQRRELTVGGVRVVVTQGTLLADEDEDDSDSRARLTFETLAVNDFLEIEGFQRRNDGGYLEASRIEREDDFDTEFDLKGRITALNGDVMTVLGLELRGASGFSGLFEGLEVEVDYRRNAGGEYVIESLEPENEDD
jgi:hypothetical protein